MSEHKGPWRHNNGEICVQRHGGVYVIGAFDAFGAFVEHSNQREFPGGFIPLVPQTEVDAVGADLAEAHIRIARLEDDLANADAELEDRQAAPSLPAVDFKDTEESLPQKLRAAAYLVDMQFDRLRCGDRPVASILYDEADRLDREQAEKAKRDKVIEQVTTVVIDHIGARPSDLIGALVTRFDITPKETS